MQLGMIGLGRMGANMARRLMRAGHECVVHDTAAAAVDELARDGAQGAKSLDAMVKKLKVYAGDSHPHAAQQPKVLEI